MKWKVLVTFKLLDRDRVEIQVTLHTAAYNVKTKTDAGRSTLYGAPYVMLVIHDI